MYPDERPIWVLEVHDHCPVVGKIFFESACCAGRRFGEVIRWIHGDVEAEIITFLNNAGIAGRDTYAFCVFPQNVSSYLNCEM